MGYYLLLLYWAFCICLRGVSRFKGDVSRLRARGTFARSGKSTQKRCLNLRFKIRPRYTFLIEISCTTRSRNMAVVVPYDELTSLLRRCRSCAATVEQKALFGVGISGSGAVAVTVL